jgi:hypothetical protein
MTRRATLGGSVAALAVLAVAAHLSVGNAALVPSPSLAAQMCLGKTSPIQAHPGSTISLAPLAGTSSIRLEEKTGSMGREATTASVRGTATTTSSAGAATIAWTASGERTRSLLRKQGSESGPRSRDGNRGGPRPPPGNREGPGVTPKGHGEGECRAQCASRAWRRGFPGRPFGKDSLNGGIGPDSLDGGADRDSCVGGRGTDTVRRCERLLTVP